MSGLFRSRAGGAFFRGPFGLPAAPLGKLFGIPVGVEPTFAPLLALLLFVMVQTLQEEYAAWPAWVIGVTAVLTVAIFIGSILLHEFGHGWMSRRLGVRVHSIVLHLFGGVAWMGREPDRARDDFLIAIAGPAVNVVLGAISLVALFLLPNLGEHSARMPVNAAEQAHWLAASAFTLNLSLLVFNCLPGFPLDGGRVMRSAIWAWSGSYRKATQWAAWTGSVFAGLLVGCGATLLVVGGVEVQFAWIALIGIFLFIASKLTLRRLPLTGGLVEGRVAEAMSPPPAAAPETLTVETLKTTAEWVSGAQSFLFAADGAEPALLSRVAAESIGKAMGDGARPAQYAVPLSQLPKLAPGDSLWKALNLMDDVGLDQLPVIADGALVGLITRRALAPSAKR